MAEVQVSAPHTTHMVYSKESDSVPLYKNPLANHERSTVYMYYYIKAITNVSVKDSTFKVVYHQYLHWHPSADEYASFVAGDMEKVTVPRILPSNCLEVHAEEEEVRGNCTAVHLLEDHGLDIWGTEMTFDTNETTRDKPLLGISRKYQVTISSGVQLQSFPVDVQHLHMFFESMQTTALVIYKPTYVYSEALNLEFGAYASDPDYTFHDPVVEFNSFGDVPNAYACCTVTFKLTRIWTGLMMRVFLPCSMLTLLCLSVFFIPFMDVADRLAVIVTLVLALVAFLYVVSDNSPPIPYLTLGDEYITASLGFVSLTTLYVCVAVTDPVNMNTKLDTTIGWIGLALWGSIQIVYVCMAYVAQQQGAAQLGLSYSELSDAGLLDLQSTVREVKRSQVKMLYKLD